MSQKQLASFIILIILCVSGLIFLQHDDTTSLEKYNELAESSEHEFIWDGIPISPNNTLYQHPSGATYESFKQQLVSKLLALTAEEWKNDDIWMEIIQYYPQKIGWNGVYDAIESIFKKSNGTLERIHWLGTQTYEQADEPRYAIQVTARDILHKAHLHGAVWQAVFEHDGDSVDSLYSFISREICYFKDSLKELEVWGGCSHGVGHGLAKVFDNVEDAIAVCGSFEDDGQFQYGCATGVFMTAPPQWHTCVDGLFPSACFQFTKKFKKTKEIMTMNSPDPCEGLDNYHRVGCIWAFSFLYPPTRDNIMGPCQRYMQESDVEPDASFIAACYDGWFYSHTEHVPDDFGGNTRDFAEFYCSSVKYYSVKAYNICTYHIINSDITKEYNVELFELFRNET